MITRRKFLQSAIAGMGYAAAGAYLPKDALAATVGGPQATWAIATDGALHGQIWAARFTNTLPWALDPTNTVLAKALNLPASGVALAANLPPNIGFIYHPDAAPAAPVTYTIKTGQVAWPMLAPLGTPDIPTVKTWGYGNAELDAVFADGSGLPVTFPGRSFVVQRGTQINVNWRNNLVDASGNPLPHLVGVDQSVAMQTDQTAVALDAATNQETYSGGPIYGVPIAVHHHGGNNKVEFDGGPDQWSTPRRAQVGPGVKAANSDASGLRFTYDNAQEAAMLWYHDHGEGVTRINAYAGLAGLYVIRDANENLLIARNQIPSGPYELPVVVQDKCFAADGSMAYASDPVDYPGQVQVQRPDGTLVPSADGVTPLPAPTHHPEQFGDVIVVNGVAWPNLDVEPREYRLRLLNGSDSRVYVLKFGYGGATRRGGLANYLPIYKISNDLGFLNTPIQMPRDEVVIAPGERMDVVVDFKPLAAQKGARTVVVTNSGAAPFPLGAPTVPNTPGAGTVMQFNVKLALHATTAALGKAAIPDSKVARVGSNLALRGLDAATPKLVGRPKAPKGTPVRRVLLAEGTDEFGRIMPLLGSFQLPNDPPYLHYPGQTNLGTMGFSQLPTETPALNSTEVWEFWNNSADAHPIHLHLVKFRLINRETFGPSATAAGGVMSEVKPMINGWTGERLLPEFVQLSGLPVAAPEHELGWKDTVLCYPGEVTRVLVTFDRPGKFVYHCHILAHEEHDMMRWYQVV